MYSNKAFNLLINNFMVKHLLCLNHYCMQFMLSNRTVISWPWPIAKQEWAGKIWNLYPIAIMDESDAG